MYKCNYNDYTLEGIKLRAMEKRKIDSSQFPNPNPLQVSSSNSNSISKLTRVNSSQKSNSNPIGNSNRNPNPIQIDLTYELLNLIVFLTFSYLLITFLTIF